MCLNLVRLLRALGDARAVGLLVQATAWVQEQAAQFPEESRRTLFLNNPPIRRVLLDLAGPAALH